MVTREKIKTEIMYDLGAPVTKVEVPETWLDNAIDRALEVFSRYTPNSETWTSFNTASGVNKYKVPDDYMAIRTVIYKPYLWNSFFQNPYTFYDMWFYSFNNANMTDYAISDMYNDQAMRVYGINGSWTFTHPYIYLSPIPTNSIAVLVRYQRLISIERGEVRDDFWVQKYALAIVQKRLGNARSKYSSFPGPRGDVSMNGEALISEANESLIRLEDELRQEFEEPIAIITA